MKKGNIPYKRRFNLVKKKIKENKIKNSIQAQNIRLCPRSVKYYIKTFFIISRDGLSISSSCYGVLS